MKFSLKILALVLELFLVAVLIIVPWQLYLLFWRKSTVDYNFPSFQQGSPDAKLKILFLGDSTGLGTGADSPIHSVSGYFGEKFPDAYIFNNCRNGRNIDELLREFDFDPKIHYALAVIQIGGNDILKFTPYKKIEEGITRVVEKVKPMADHICILHSGNIGLAPAFIWPFNEIMSKRSRDVRQIYIRKANELGVMYVDLYTTRKDDLFLKDIPKYYSSDMLHPSENGYYWWFQRINETLNEANIKLEKYN